MKTRSYYRFSSLTHAGLTALLSFVLTSLVQAEKLHVVVHPGVDISQLSRSQVVNIFMGRNQKLSNKQLAMPLDIANHQAIKAAFYRRLIDRDLAEVNSYWVRVMFSGEASRPRQVDSFRAVRRLLKEDIGAIAYVPESALAEFETDDYKIVYTLDDDD